MVDTGQYFKNSPSKVASILWSHHEETRETPGEIDNARNNAMQVHVGEGARTAWMDNSSTWTGLPWKSQSE